MRIPLPWRRKSNPAVHQLSSSPPGLSRISLPATPSSSSSSTSPPTSPGSPTSPRLPETSPPTPTTLHTRPHTVGVGSPPPQPYRPSDGTDSTSTVGISLELTSATDTTECTTTYTDLYASTATHAAVEEDTDGELTDDFLALGVLPCGPRWLADNADDSARQHRANAQIGALAALTGGRPSLL